MLVTVAGGGWSAAILPASVPVGSEVAGGLSAWAAGVGWGGGEVSSDPLGGGGVSEDCTNLPQQCRGIFATITKSTLIRSALSPRFSSRLGTRLRKCSRN